MCVCAVASVKSDSATQWTVVNQGPLSMGFSRQGYCSGLPCPPPGDHPNPGISPMSPASPALQVGSLRVSHWGSPGHVHTAIFKMNNQQGPTVEHMELCSMFCGNLDGRGFGGEWTCIRTAESLHCSPETITTLLISYTPIQNKNCF